MPTGNTANVRPRTLIRRNVRNYEAAGPHAFARASGPRIRWRAEHWAQAHQVSKLTTRQTHSGTYFNLFLSNHWSLALLERLLFALLHCPGGLDHFVCRPAPVRRWGHDLSQQSHALLVPCVGSFDFRASKVFRSATICSGLNLGSHSRRIIHSRPDHRSKQSDLTSQSQTFAG